MLQIKNLILIAFMLLPVAVFSQGYNEKQTTLANFLKRMYNQTKFEGARIVEDYDNEYLISVLSLEKSNYKKESDMFRVAQVKALRQASEFVNGATITADAVIRTSESNKGTDVTVETVEKMRSVGFVQGMELLINFEPDEQEMVFIYIRKIDVDKKSDESSNKGKNGKKNKK
jgi:hypothetical protein